jgi:hypothetical protein
MYTSETSEEKQINNQNFATLSNIKNRVTVRKIFLNVYPKKWEIPLHQTCKIIVEKGRTGVVHLA